MLVINLEVVVAVGRWTLLLIVLINFVVDCSD